MLSALARFLGIGRREAPPEAKPPEETFLAADAAGNRYTIRVRQYEVAINPEFAVQGWAPTEVQTFYETEAGKTVTRVSTGVYEVPGPAGEVIRVTSDDPKAS